jgi:hypothetical protein
MPVWPRAPRETLKCLLGSGRATRPGERSRRAAKRGVGPRREYRSGGDLLRVGDRLASNEHPRAAEPDEPLDTTAQTRPTESEPEPRTREAAQHQRAQSMVPGRERRRLKVERGATRVIATGGIIGIAVVPGAVLVDRDVAGWIVGLAVGLTSMILAALLGVPTPASSDWPTPRIEPGGSAFDAGERCLGTGVATRRGAAHRAIARAGRLWPGAPAHRPGAVGAG